MEIEQERIEMSAEGHEDIDLLNPTRRKILPRLGGSQKIAIRPHRKSHFG
jgi:hypothetical protein